MKNTLLISLLLTSLPSLANDDCLYTYKAQVTDVYDGDTITVNVDLGFHTWIHDEKIRLARINAPEVKGKEKEAGIASRDWLRERILGKTILLRTLRDKREKFGRYLGELYLDESNINDELVTTGHAIYQKY